MALYKTTTATDQNVDTTLRDHYWDPPHITSVQYCGGCSVHRRDNISTMGDSFSTVGDSFSTAEVVQYSGGIASILWGDSFSIVEVVQYSGG